MGELLSMIEKLQAEMPVPPPAYLQPGQMPPMPPVIPAAGTAENGKPSNVLVIENAETGRTYLTAPIETAGVVADDFLLHVQGLLVEAERANRNGAYWSVGDLAFGLPSVVHGPMNWLHQDRKIVGTITDAELVTSETAMETLERELEAEEAKAAFVPAGTRRKMAGTGVAMPDGSFPVPDQGHLESAVKLAHTPAQRRHVKKRAKALGHSEMIPASWRETASIGNAYIRTEAVIWAFLYPGESAAIREFASQGKLFQSMECVSDMVQCVGPNGCGHTMDYLDAQRKTEKACAHVRERSSTRRFVQPIFQGAGIIVPPVTPALGTARLELLRSAERMFEQPEAASMFGEDEALAAEVLRFVREGAIA